MHQPELVGMAQSGSDLVGETNRFSDAELLLALQPLSQRLPLDERHDVVEEGGRAVRR